MVVRGYRKDSEGKDILLDIFDIEECTYSGKDMGERYITATIYWPSPIDFQMGDYVTMQMQSLERGSGVEGSVGLFEKFYIYTMPTVKKVANPMQHGKAFEHTITFYPAQYELGLVQMRDLGDGNNNVIYSGFDQVSLYCGANELMEYIMQVLKKAYDDGAISGEWSYRIANSVNENENTSLERFPISFSGNSVMDALLKLADKDGINTTFFINERTVYVGFKRPYFCRVNDLNDIDTDPATQIFNFKYGQTSHQNTAINYGGLFDITKSVGKESPITKLFSYGASRNLNRYYCSDKIVPGRYVNRLMLPSFSSDGVTDFILSQSGVEKYGVREGSKQFEDIYPSLRYVTNGDIRQIKYCIKIKPSGLISDDVKNKVSDYPIARIQCYRVEESDTIGVNKLTPAAPPEDIAVYVHATGKVVKVILRGGESDYDAYIKQKQYDGKVPTRTLGGEDYIPGSCFLVHDPKFKDNHTSHLLKRSDWFTSKNEFITENPDEKEQARIDEIIKHQINYDDADCWITDLYVFDNYNQTYFNRAGYSAWAYPKINGRYITESGYVAHDSIGVNEIAGVQPILIEDTTANIYGVDVNTNQQTFDVYLRDIGFKINEQSDFGQMVFVQDGTVKISILDGLLEGREFELAGSVLTDSCICAYDDDGVINYDFFGGDPYHKDPVAEKAFQNGAIWRLRFNRNDTQPEFADLGIALPNTRINAAAGDHLVLLDLYMPDIYIKAAENRLLREAKKYLDANDSGRISYAISLDNVRIQQIPNYALQMREGLNLRIVDNDLGIRTESSHKTLFNNLVQNSHSMYETTYDSKPSTEYYYTFDYRNYNYLLESGVVTFYTGNSKDVIKDGIAWNTITHNDSTARYEGYVTVTVSNEDKARINENSTNEVKAEVYFKDNKLTFRCAKVVRNETGGYDKLTNIYFTFNITNIEKKSDGDIRVYVQSPLSMMIPMELYDKADNEIKWLPICEYGIRYSHPYDVTLYTPNTHLLPKGVVLYAPSKTLVTFKANKHYEVTIEAAQTDLLKLRGDGYPEFRLINNLGSNLLYYNPDCIVTEYVVDSEYNGFKFSFTLDEWFNDSIDYYPSLIYVSDNKTEYVSTRLMSITESDFDSMQDVNYADLSIQEVTIKITDSDKTSFAKKEISAVLSEQKSASSWSTLMNRIENTEHESDENSRITQEVINAARKNRLSLLNLRNTIFDPDGKCNQVFLQVMMMQVGADSMNYYLDKTMVDAKGNPHNCSCNKDETDGFYHFIVGGEDVLHHIVFTDQGGDWHIPHGIDVALSDIDGVFLTYFVSIKCDERGNEGEWVCTPVQHAVNDEVGYYHFNWGILSPDSQGNYTLTETRGNAYMYGDNLFCGRISTQAKDSWFDLTKGEFVLGERADGTAALKYENGVLTISGVPSQSDIDAILNKVDRTVGGENYVDLGESFIINTTANVTPYESNLTLTPFHNEVYEHGEQYTVYDLLPAGEYVFSAEKISGYSSGASGVPNAYARFTLIAFNSENNINREFSITENSISDYALFITEPCYFVMKIQIPVNSIGDNLYVELTKVSIQKGRKSTSYQPHVKHLTDAIKGSTEAAGGLVATNLILLKDEHDNIVAGLSGLSDSNTMGSFEDDTHSEGVSLWSGGDYKKALDQAMGMIKNIQEMLPILLTKTGIGSKIGCFTVVDSQTVAIYNQSGNERILIGVDDGIRFQSNEEGTEYKDNIVISNNDVDISLSSDPAVIKAEKRSGVKLMNSFYFTSEESLNNGSYCAYSGTRNLLKITLTKLASDWYNKFTTKVSVWITSDLSDVNGSFTYYFYNKVQFSSEEGSYEINIPINSLSEKIMTLEGDVYLCVRCEDILQYHYKKSNASTNITDIAVATVELKSNINIASTIKNSCIKIGKNGMLLQSSQFNTILCDLSKEYTSVHISGLPDRTPDVAGTLYVENGIVKIS